jgi:ABC-2 type transport system ATP-binding protein
VLVTTHYMDEADRLCDRIAIIDHGELKALDSPLTLKASIAGQTVIEVTFSTTPDGWLDRLSALAGVDRVVQHGPVFRVHATNGPAAASAIFGAAAAAGLTVASLAVQSTTLDDVFVHYTGRDLRDTLQAAPARTFPQMGR